MVSRELVAASTRPLVLSVLATGENYGYAIIQQVVNLSGGELSWSALSGIAPSGEGKADSLTVENRGVRP